MVPVQWLAAEPLESRIAPAGVVRVYVSHGDLFIVGDAGDHRVDVVGGAGTDLVITGYDGTLLKVGTAAPTDAPVTISQALRDLHISMGKGSDQLALVEVHTLRNVTVAMGGGENNSLEIGLSDILGSLQITGRGTANSVNLISGEATTSIGRDLSVKFSGEGSLGASGDGLKVGGQFSYRGGAGSDSVQLSVKDLQVFGAFHFYPGRGHADFRASGTDQVLIGGPVRIVASARIEETVSVDFSSAGALNFGGAVSFSHTSGGTSLSFFADDMDFAAGLTARLGRDGIQIAANNFHAAGPVKILSEGELGFEFQAAGRVVLDSSLTVKSGPGFANFGFDGSGVIRGKVTLDFGRGESAAAITADLPTGLLMLEGGLTVKSGARTSGDNDQTFNFFLQHVALNGPSIIASHGGSDDIDLEGVLVNAPLLVTTAGGIDTIDFDSTEFLSTVNATVTLLTGHGDDTIYWGNLGGVDATARVTFVGGAGQDTLDYLNPLNTFTIPPIIVGIETVS